MFRCKGNKTSRGHGLHLSRVRRIILKLGRGEAPGRAQVALAFVVVPEMEAFEVEFPLAIAHRFESHFLSDEGIGDVLIASLPLDLAAGLHPAFLPLVGVTALARQAFRIITRGRLVDFRRWALSERFVRAFLVVLAPELIK